MYFQFVILEPTEFRALRRFHISWTQICGLLSCNVLRYGNSGIAKFSITIVADLTQTIVVYD